MFCLNDCNKYPLRSKRHNELKIKELLLLFYNIKIFYTHISIILYNMINEL